MSVFKNKCESFSNALTPLDYICTISITLEWGRKSNKQWDPNTLEKSVPLLTSLISSKVKSTHFLFNENNIIEHEARIFLKVRPA